MDKSLASLIKKEFRDEKSVRTAINRLQDGTYRIVDDTVEQSDAVK